MQIKFHRIDRLIDEHRSQLHDILDTVIDHGQALKDKSVTQLENAVAKMANRKYAIAVGSCTDALTLALQALNINIYSRVLVTPFSFDASFTCVESLGATRVDPPIETKYHMIDLDKLCSNIDFYGENIDAIIAVNLFGQMMDMDLLSDISKDYSIPMIEDAAQSFTSNWKGKPAGSFGSISCLSFDPTKICPALGTGGMVLTDDYKLADDVRFRHYKNYGRNSQMSSFNTKLILYWLDFIPHWEETRRTIAERYLNELHSIKEITLPETNLGSKHIYHKFVISCERRNELKDFLKDKGVETKIHYPSNPNVLSLPIYPNLYDYEVKEVCEWIRKFYS